MCICELYNRVKMQEMKFVSKVKEKKSKTYGNVQTIERTKKLFRNMKKKKERFER